MQAGILRPTGWAQKMGSWVTGKHPENLFRKNGDRLFGYFGVTMPDVSVTPK